MAGFAVGYCAYHIRERSGWVRRAAPLLFFSAVAGTLLLTFAVPQNPNATITIWSAWEVPYIALLGALVVSLHAEGRHCRAFSHRLAVYLGELSYALYLVHYVAFSLLVTAFFGGAEWRQWLAGDWSVLPILGIAVLAAVVISAAVYHVIELPGRRWLRRLAPSGLGHLAPTASPTYEVRRAA
jgi:peptidoglycan/LPS O-acetylase OafA/YrhL